MRTRLDLADFLILVRDGDEHGWAVEYDYLWWNHPRKMRRLVKSIQRRGIREPLLIGTDGRLWDGHHRVAAAMHIGLGSIPVVWAGDKG